MIDYRSCECSHCHKPLHEGDDIVVCPECGAPYHRDCYAAAGGCVFRAKHGTGFAFVPPQTQDTGVRCPSCNAPNNPDNIFCERCGHPLREAAGSAAPHTSQASGGAAGFGGAQQQGGYAAGSVPFGGVGYGMPAPAREYDGIDSAAWSAYIGRSAPYYLYQFSRMDAQKRKTSICWSALFFAPMYFFYRRMWGWGILSFVASLLLSIPSYINIFQTFGAAGSAAAPSAVLSAFSWICFILSWAMSLFFALYAFYLFRRHAGKKLHEMQQACADKAGMEAALARTGGPSVLAVVVLFAVLVALNMFLISWIGPERLAASMYF